MRHVDVAVVGGGPVGCVSALAHAQRGAKVAVLEASTGNQERFAGELLHPRAVDILRSVGVDVATAIPEGTSSKGFSVFTQHDAAPILLPYDNRRGVSARFAHLVQALRQETGNNLAVRYMGNCKVTRIDGQVVHFERAGGAKGSLRADRIIGAGGRFSIARRSLGLPDNRHTLSHMAGLTLKGARLPNEGFGHVVLGGPGPALAYRIDSDHVRICLDVPKAWRRAANRDQLIWEAYEPVLPELLRQPIHDALRADEVQWAVIAMRARTDFGREGLCLVGDAVGHYHPMTAAGMTLGFADAYSLAQADNVEMWKQARLRDAETLSLLATALYEIFAVESPATEACRQAIFDMWTHKPASREASIRFLSGDDTARARFFALGVELVSRASLHVVRTGRRPDHWLGALTSLRNVGGLLHWLAHETVPDALRYRLVSDVTTPFLGLREAHAARLALRVGKGQT
jgi:squalene monooxygenase